MSATYIANKIMKISRCRRLGAPHHPCNGHKRTAERIWGSLFGLDVVMDVRPILSSIQRTLKLGIEAANIIATVIEST